VECKSDEFHSTSNRKKWRSEKIGDSGTKPVILKYCNNLLQAPSNSGRDNTAGIIVKWWTNTPQCCVPVLRDHTIGPKISENGDNYSTAPMRNMRRLWEVTGLVETRIVGKTEFLWNVRVVSFTVLAIEKSGDQKKLEILVQNQSFWNIDNLLQAPSNSGRDNAAGIIIVWWTSPPLILQIHSLHQIATGTPSHVPPRCRGIIITIFWDFGTNCMVP